jgi:hypothetical protein
MATGWPMKTTYANGDVYSAGDVNDITGTVNLLQTSTLSYQAAKNPVINGNFDIWQRGTSFAAAVDTAFCADRWQTTRAGTTVNLTATQDTSVPNRNAQYSLKFQQVTSGATSLVQYAARQLIENSNILPLLGKSVTLSFWYRSNKTGSHGYRVLGNYNTGGTDQASTFTVSVADTWEYKTIAITAFSAVSAVSASPTATGGLVDIGFRVFGQGFTTLSTNDYFQISQVQLEVGSVATPFSRAGGTIQGELAACQRYYYRNTDVSGNKYQGTGQAMSTTIVDTLYILPVTMRVDPTPLETSNMGIYCTGATRSGGTFTLLYANPNTTAIRYTHGSAVFTNGQPSWLLGTAANSYVGLSAEL